MTLSTEFSTIRRRWLELILLYAALIAHMLLYGRQPGKGQSLSFRVLVAGIVGLALVVSAFTAWLTPRRRDWAARHFTPVRGLWLAGGAAVLLGFGAAMRPEWVYAQIALTLAATVALMFITCSTRSDLGLPRWLWLAGAGMGTVAVSALRIAGLSYYPRVNIMDEPWDMSWAVSYVHTGHLSDAMMAGGGMDIPRVLLLRGVWFDLVGVGLWEGRLVSFVLAMLTIGVVMLAARNLYGRTAGWIAGAFMLSSAITMGGLRLRHDIDLALMLALSLWVYSEARQRARPALHGLAGAIVGLGWFAHYNAVFMGVVLTLGLYGPAWIGGWRTHRFRPQRDMVFFVVGGLLGAGCVFLVQIMPHWDEFLVARSVRHPANVSGYFELVRGHIANIALFSQVELVLVVAGLGAALWRRRGFDLSLSVIVILGHLALGAFTYLAFDYLLVPFTPFYALLVASLFVDRLRCAADESAARLSPAAAVLCVCILAANLGWTLRIPAEHVAARDPLRLPAPAAAQWVLEHVPPGTRISGEHYYYFWLYDYDYVSSTAPSLMRPEERRKYATVTDVWAAWDVQVFIIDPNLSTFGLFDPLLDGDFMAQHGYRVVAELPGTRVPIVIYMQAAAAES